MPKSSVNADSKYMKRMPVGGMRKSTKGPKKVATPMACRDGFMYMSSVDTRWHPAAEDDFEVARGSC